MNDKNNIFSLTEDDKIKYLNQIQNFDLSRKSELLSLIPEKLNTLLKNDSFNSIELHLINDLVLLYKMLEDNPKMDEEIQKKICFALDYFSDEDDEIPDSIPNFGFLDDAAIINWIVKSLQGELQKKVIS